MFNKGTFAIFTKTKQTQTQMQTKQNKTKQNKTKKKQITEIKRRVLAARPRQKIEIGAQIKRQRRQRRRRQQQQQHIDNQIAKEEVVETTKQRRRRRRRRQQQRQRRVSVRHEGRAICGAVRKARVRNRPNVSLVV